MAKPQEGGASRAYLSRKPKRTFGRRLVNSSLGTALGTAYGNHIGGYRHDAMVKSTRRHFKKHQRIDESVQGRLEYKTVGAVVSGGKDFLKAINKVRSRQVFGKSEGQYGGDKAKFQKAKPDSGGTEYDPYGRPLTKVPIAIGGFPYAGFDVHNHGGFLSYDRTPVDSGNPFYLGLFSPHVAIA